MWWTHDHFMFGGFWMILFWIAIIAITVWIVKLISDRSEGGGGRRSADRSLDILNERYARGEIDKEEYDRRKQDILSG